MLVQETDYLEHYGRLGMKWYHHIFGEEDPRAEYYHGSKSSSNSKSENTSESSKRSKNQKTSSNKMPTAEKVAIGVGIGAAVTIGALAAYKIYSRDYVDRILKPGMTLQTITTAKNMDLGKRFYASFEKGDKEIYKGLFGKMQKNANPDKAINAIQMTIIKNTKAASPHNASKIFEKLYNGDSEFREVVDGMRKFYMGDGDHSKDRKLSSKDIRSTIYNMFNTQLVSDEAGVVQKNKYGYITKSTDIRSIQKKFYDALKEAGYNAVVDINDLKNSRTVRSKSPIIVFDASGIVQSAVHELSDKEIHEAYIPAIKREKFRQFIEDNSDAIKMTGGLLGGGYAASIAGYDVYRNTNNKTKKNSQKR